MAANNNSSKTDTYPLLLMTWVIAFLLLKYGLQFLPGVNIEYFTEKLHYSAEQIGFLAASYFYAYLILQIPAGIIIDQFRLSIIIFTAMTITAVGMILFAYEKNLATTIIARILMGSGVAFATVAYMRTAAIYFGANAFSKFSGFFGTVCMGGSGLIILIFGRINAQWGWHTLLITVMIATILSAATGFYFMSQEKRHPPLTVPAQRPFSLSDTFGHIALILKEKNNLLLLAYNGLAFAPIAVFGGLWGKSYFSYAFHMSSMHCEWLVSSIFYGFGLGGLILFRIFTKLKQQRYLMVQGILIALLLFITMLYFMPDKTPFYVLLIVTTLIGVFASGFLASYTLTKVNNSPAYLATAIAVVNMGDPIFGGIAEPLMGKIIDSHHGNYTAGMVVLIAYWLLAIVTGVFIRHQVKYRFFS